MSKYSAYMQGAVRDDKGAKLTQLVRSSPESAEWFAELEAADSRSIIAAIGGMASSGDTGAHLDGYRDAASAMVAQKLTDRTIEALDRLNTSTTQLSKVGIAVAVVAAIGTIVGAIGAVLSFVGAP